MPTLDFQGLNIRLQKQDQLYWCYAAVISVLSHWLNGGNGWSACQIASWAVWQNILGGENLGNDTLDGACNCCQKNRPNACDTATAAYSTRPILNHMNIAYNRMAGGPDFDTIKTEIDADRPILLELKPRAGGTGHVSLIVGYKREKNTTATIVMYDPSAYKIPYYRDITNLQTMTFDVPMVSLFGAYPTDKYRISHHYVNLVLGGGGLTAAPGWATFHN